MPGGIFATGNTFGYEFRTAYLSPAPQADGFSSGLSAAPQTEPPLFPVLTGKLVSLIIVTFG